MSVGQPQIPRAPERAQHSRSRRKYWVLGAVAALVGCLLAMALRIDAYGQVDRAEKADAIVVLGARVLPGGAAGDSLSSRTLRAVELYQRGIAPVILCTGGIGDNPPAEAKAAATLAAEHGVRDADLVLEEHSTSTRENAEFAARICRERGWKRVVVVSDPYHLYRARNDFKRAGLVAYTSPALECRRNRVFSERVWWTLRETALVIRDKF
ncbi:MAG: YdcF family protein [Actinomycetota bacterium]